MKDWDGHRLNVLQKMALSFMRERSDTDYSDIQSKWGDQIQPISLDVSSMSGIKEAISKVMQKTEHLDVLVNNSGIYLENNKLTAET